MPDPDLDQFRAAFTVENGREAHAGIGSWITFYNGRRPHQALGSRTPMAVWREGISGALDNLTVDMTLRLDNASALPTCPQPQTATAAICSLISQESGAAENPTNKPRPVVLPTGSTSLLPP